LANRDVLAVGTSAGGVEALIYLVKRFPADFPAAVLVTIHLASNFNSSLDGILTRAGCLPAIFVREREELQKGRIFLAPPGRHLIVEADSVLLGKGPRENNVRPAIDPMLRSAAACCGHRTVGVVLTGTQGDGAAGLWVLGQYGGLGVVQDPADAAFPEMPLTALNRAKPQYVVPLAKMPALLDTLARQDAGEHRRPTATLKYEVEVAKSGSTEMSEMDYVGARSILACPDCHGTMWEIEEGDLIRYRCHEGHAYTAEVMSLALDENLRRALASGLRALEERVALAERLERQASQRGHSQTANEWADKRKDYETEAGIIRNAIRRADAIAVKMADNAS
jgi:two-component system, chemotaxis family, protein-glutamate methylesterase/glutaminase